MRITTIARGAALVALIAAAVPAPASAQFGFIKKQLKQRIVHAVVDTALSRVAGQAADSAGASRSGAAAALAGGTGRTRATASPQGPKFDEYVVEITPQALDRLENYLKEQKADRNSSGRATRRAVVAGPNADLTTVQFGLMTQRVVAFCASTGGPGAGGAAMGVVSASNGLLDAYTPAEIAALRPRCARITSLLGADS